ncbi:MAG TPA: hypothetical protein VGJ39_12725 [Vicinamibacterales bacterium]
MVVTIAIKLAAAALLVLASGVPVLDTWKALFVAATWLALVFGSRRTGWWRLGAAAAIVLTVIGLKAILPRADIAEAHNAFLVIHDGEALQRGLPADVFASWKQQFDAVYPPDHEPYGPRSQWREYGGSPKALFTVSSDAIWRAAKYTRQVDAIDFRNLGEFRGGFANELQYNFWAGELRRESMPFYAMYELTPASVGSQLIWQGQVFWEKADGGFEEIIHDQIAGRGIAPQDVGRHVYAVFLPKRDGDRRFRLDPSLKLRLAGWTDLFLSVAGGWSVLLLMIRPRWHQYFRALLIFAAAYVFMTSFLMVSTGKYLGRNYPPQGGGDDGLTHDGVGRAMALLVGRGEIVEALKGEEPVYWKTPGMRYFRMLEKTMFGDTNHLYALVVSCIPIVVFYLVRHFTTTRWAWLMTGLFIVLIVGNFSFLNYIANAKLGYGEALAGLLFLIGLVLLLRTQPAWGGTDGHAGLVWVAGAALAASMFVRPNFALAVVWLGAAHAWASARRGDFGSIVALGLGLAFALWMPFHNWYYGREFYLISKSGATVSVPLGIRDYTSAVGDLLRGRRHTAAMDLTSQQVKGWLWDPGLLVRPGLTPAGWAFHGVKLLALVTTCWVAMRWVAGRFRTRTDLAIVAVTAIFALIPMLFIFSTHYRYAMLGWDLSLVVLMVSLARSNWAHAGRFA